MSARHVEASLYAVKYPQPPDARIACRQERISYSTVIGVPLLYAPPVLSARGVQHVPGVENDLLLLWLPEIIPSLT